MGRKVKDVFYVQSGHQPDAAQIAVLSELYLPLIGRDAFSLYLVLSSEGMLNHGQETHQRLLVLTDMDINMLDNAFAKLEEYMLVRSWQKEGDAGDSWIYCLNAPLSPGDFIDNRIYMSSYLKRTGRKECDSSKAKFTAGRISLQGYRDVTAPVKNIMDLPSVGEDSASVKAGPEYRFNAEDTDIHFDYEHFIATTSTLVFPAVMRTPHTMSLIGRLATVFGLSADRMRILVGRCVNLDTMEFDEDRLRFLAEKSAPDITKARDPYDLPPVSYLQSRQNGAQVSQTDRRILEHLSVDMHFSNEVINIMMDYILKVSDNRINGKFVDMVAGEWARSGITTRKQALGQVKRDLARQDHRSGYVRIDLPSYMKEEEQTEEKKATPEQIEAFRKLQQEARKK